MSAFLEERVLTVHHWTERLFSFTTTRDPALRSHICGALAAKGINIWSAQIFSTNDGYALNAIRSRPVTERHVRAALESAAGGPLAEGSVGAGTGTVAFGWKGGIGTSSRRIPTAVISS